MKVMYVKLLFPILGLLFSSTIHATSLPLTGGTHTPSSLKEHPATNSETTQNTTYHPLTFLGVNCYYLQPATVDLQTCQPLFAKMFGGGHVYERHQFYSGYWFQSGYEPCVIQISATAREDRRAKVSISIAEVVSYASEVLETCRESGSGGANTFQRSWQVVVTREGIKGSVGYGSIKQE